MWLIDKLFHNSPTENLHQQGVERLLEPENLSSPDLHEPKIPDHYRPLLELQERRQLVEVKLGGDSQAYQSMVLVVDAERELIWLDDLFPLERELSIGEEICIRHHKQGEQLIIRSSIVAFGENYGASGIAILIPEHIAYTPRRHSPRFAVGSQSTLGVKIRTIGQEPCFGSLQDISSGGLRMLIPGNIIHSLRHGALIPLCEVSLDKNVNIRCRARICSFRTSRTPFRHTQVSVEFTDLDQDSHSLLEQFLQKIALAKRANRTPAAHAAA